MTIEALQQLIADCEQEKSAFAVAILAVFYIENAQNDAMMQKGVELLQMAGDGKNVLWAKNIMLYMRKIRPLEQPFSHHTLVEDETLKQLEIYAAKGDVWAMTILGKLLYTGYSNPKNESDGTKYLNIAADRGCLLAQEYIDEYGISKSNVLAFDKMYDAFQNLNGQQWWMTK